MILLLFLIPLSVLIASGFLAAFIWAVRAGQFDDTSTPALRPLMEEGKRSARKPANPATDSHANSRH